MLLIGLTPTQDEATGRITVNQDYLDAVVRAGAAPVLLPLTTDPDMMKTLLSRVDALVMIGGADVGPECYGEEKLPLCQETSPLRDAMEFPLARMAIQMDKPLLAVCRGLQVLSCALGGTLYQDIAAQFSPAVSHPRHDMPRDKVHEVKVEKDSLLYRITGLDSFGVNSRHHQAVKALGKGLKPCAYAPDGLLEAAELQGSRFVLGVQWHPESLSDRYSEAQALFNALAEAAKA